LTKGEIERNILKQQLNAMELLIPDAEFTAFEFNDIQIDESVAGIWEARKNGSLIGFCVLVNNYGFVDIIKIAVGVSYDEEIIGVEIISINETPGLGSRAAEPEYLSQYLNKSYGKTGLKLTKDTNDKSDGAVHAISGATITSEAVVKSVNTALKTVRQIIYAIETAEITES